jgi:hypothetical protein
MNNNCFGEAPKLAREARALPGKERSHEAIMLAQPASKNAAHLPSFASLNRLKYPALSSWACFNVIN